MSTWFTLRDVDVVARAAGAVAQIRAHWPITPFLRSSLELWANNAADLGSTQEFCRWGACARPSCANHTRTNVSRRDSRMFLGLTAIAVPFAVVVSVALPANNNTNTRSFISWGGWHFLPATFKNFHFQFINSCVSAFSVVRRGRPSVVGPPACDRMFRTSC